MPNMHNYTACQSGRRLLAINGAIGLFASNNYFIKNIDGNQTAARQPGRDTPQCVNNVNIKIYDLTTGDVYFCIFVSLHNVYLFRNV